MSVQNDYENWESTEAVTVTLKRSGGNTAIAVANAKRAALTRQEQLLGGTTLRGDETVWSIPVTLLQELNASVVIREGDTIATGDEVWQIIKPNLLRLGSRWRCVCRLNR